MELHLYSDIGVGWRSGAARARARLASPPLTPPTHLLLFIPEVFCHSLSLSHFFETLFFFSRRRFYITGYFLEGTTHTDVPDNTKEGEKQ